MRFATGVAVALIATVLTWVISVHIIDDLSQSVPALALQAATGLLAIVVLLVVMNWFFHKVYWTGWISLHNKRKRQLLERADDLQTSRFRLLLGNGVVRIYVILSRGVRSGALLQSYRLRLGDRIVFWERP